MSTSTVLITFTTITLILAISILITVISDLIAAIITSRVVVVQILLKYPRWEFHVPLPKIGHYKDWKELRSPLFVSNPMHAYQKKGILGPPEGLSRIRQQKLSKSGLAYLKRNSDCTSDTTYLEVHGP